MSLSVVILAGGLATRIRPLTDAVPKQMIPINGEPFAFHQLRSLRAAGITKVVYCLGYKGEMVRDAVGDGGSFGLSIDYSFDGPTLLGTAGAIVRALPLLEDRFFVLYGDSYLDLDYAAVEAAFVRSGKRALMTVFHNEGRWDTSNVELRDGAIATYSKARRNERMAHIDYGLSACRKSVFAALAEGVAIDLADVYETLAEAGDLDALPVDRRFFEIGSFEGIKDLEEHMQRRNRTDGLVDGRMAS